MRILLASPDRDLLKMYVSLLSSDDREIIPAFDGTQVIMKLVGEKFDAVIIEDDIPRVGADEIMYQCRARKIPVILLSVKRPELKKLIEGSDTDRFIGCPFLHCDLERSITDIEERIISGG